MMRRFLAATLLAACALLAIFQESAIAHHLRSYTSSSWWYWLERVVSFDTLHRSPLAATGQEEDDLSPLSLGWVRRLVRDFPELRWYAHDQVYRTFEGSYQVPHFSWSKTLYGKHYPEFDRAVLSIWCLRAFYNGSHEAWRQFIFAQDPDEALSWSCFQEIHHQLARFAENHPWMSKEQVILTMETYLLLADCGKTPQAQGRAQPWKIQGSDMREFFQRTLEQCPEIYPSLKRLPYPCLELIRRTAYPIHLGHLRHLEAQPASLRCLSDSQLLQNYPVDFEFYYLVDLCDSAAFLGQQNVHGSLFLTEPIYQVNVMAKSTCESIQQLDEYDAYMNYLSERATGMGLDPDIKQDRVLTRIGAMLRLNDKRYGSMLRRSFSKLNIYLQALIIAQLDVRIHDPLKCTPNYIPAVLTNLLQNEKLGSSFQERLDKTFVLGLPFIATVLQAHRQALSSRRSEPSVALNFNGVAQRVGENPYILNHVRYHIDERNRVQIE